MSLVTDQAIIARLSEVFEEDSLQLVETRVNPKLPKTGVNWHIDSDQLLYFEPSILNDDSGDFHSITTWLAIGDVPVEMGAMQMVHYKQVDIKRLIRTKRDEDPREGNVMQSGRYGEACANEARRLHDHIKTFPMKAGEFCMFDPRNLHTGAPNLTDRLRLGLVMRYCASHVTVNPKFSKRKKLQITWIKNGKVAPLQ